MRVTNRTALITGITGQDGSYLAELLLEKGYHVHGIVRRASTFNTHRIDHLYQDPHDPQARLFLHHGDLTDGTRMANLLEQVRPDEVYHLAAQSHVRVSFDEPEFTGNTTGLGTTRLLEVIRVMGLPCRFYQASSSEMFGATPPPQHEATPFHPRSPYGVAKVYAYWATRNYREAYGLYAVNGILFNHESPRRGLTFVTRKAAVAAARIKAGLQDVVYLGNLEARRDARYLRPSEVDNLVGDGSKAERLLGWRPQVLAPQLARLMVDAEVAALLPHAAAEPVSVTRPLLPAPGLTVTL
jgi:GDPmannose 4,6-dehydratase